MVLQEILGRRWSPASKATAGIGLALAVFAFLLIRAEANRIRAMEPGPPVPVVVAARAVPRGAVLQAADLRTEQMPARWAPPGRIESPGVLVGRSALAPIAPAEPVTSTRVSGSAPGSLSALVPPGLRAVTVNAGTSGAMVRPGDLVDVMVTYAGSTPYTETLATSVEVLRNSPHGEAGSLGSEPDGPALVLLADPAQAERLAGAQALGTLSLALAPAAETEAGAE
jgi:pilus assembly protein CpaB